MPPNIAELIENVNEETTVADFKTILKGIKEDVDQKDKAYEDLNLKVVKLIEQTARGKGQEETASPEEQTKQFFQSAVKSQTKGFSAAEVYKYGGRMVRDDKEWSEGKWDIGKIPGEEKAALGTVLRGDATTGSYLVPIQYESEIFALAKQASVMMGKVYTVPMATRDIYWPKQLTACAITWVTDETTAKTETNPTFSQVHLECETCAAWLTVTEELLEDYPGNLGDFFKNQFVEAWAQEFDKQVLNSNASPFTSILYNTSCNILNMGTGKTAFSDVGFSDLIDMENAISAAVGEVGLRGAVFIMHRKVFNYLRQKKDDDGQYLYQKPAEGVPATIWGYPYIISDQMPYTDAADSPFLILGNPKYWLHGNRIGLQFQTFDNTIRKIDYDQIFYRFRLRQAFVGQHPEAFAVLETAAS